MRLALIVASFAVWTLGGCTIRVYHEAPKLRKIERELKDCHAQITKCKACEPACPMNR